MTGPRTFGGVNRRSFITLCTMAGLADPLAGALWRTATSSQSDSADLAAQAPAAPEPPRITDAMLVAAAAVIGLDFTEAERAMMLEDVNSALQAWAQIRGVKLANAVMPAVRFDPLAGGVTALGGQPKPGRRVTRAAHAGSGARPARPATPTDLAYASVAELGALLRTRQVSSVELTRLYLDRLKLYDPTLVCVVNLTEERALEQAEAADREIARGKWRGPLHGIPWGAKDLLAVAGYPTTWGSPIYRDQVINENATVVDRLDRAGAVLVAKLSLGEFAQGDVWFGGTTKNPWKFEQGSSGSSAGPGSATAAGLVGFSIGSETLGSIVSPSTRNGVTGLRPTFGRVSRAGAMALSWTMDKLGPMCRTAEDCGLVFSAIYGPDGKDPTVVDRPFDWTPGRPLTGLRVGYLKSAFEADHPTKAFDDQALQVLRGLGVDLVPVDLPTDLPVTALRIILSAEAAAAFDELTRTGEDDRMVRQGRGAWPNTFRVARLIPAVEYIQANRIRTLLMQRLDEVMRAVDVFVAPSFANNLLIATNLTGHPCLVLPNGFNPDGTPVSLSFIGRLFGESELLTVGEAYQKATGFHLKRPPAFR
ncbi:MAG: amidase [Gemmatimonadota bacterium]